MSEQITHYTHCCATCRHAEAGGPCAWRHDNADGDCCPDWEYGNHAAWLGDDTPYPMASREITAEPHGSMEEHTALCEHTRVESLPDRRKQLPHHVMVLHSQKGLLAAAALAYRYGKELHPAGTAAKLQELAKERDARIVELEAQVAAFRAPAEAAGYTVSADGKCWTGNGGGREFVQGPPINVTQREEPAPWMAAMARDARCPECLGMMRKRGMTEEPEEQCSEPVAVMMRVRCHAVVRALDSTTTLHTYTDADGPCCEINWGDQVSPIGAAHETLALREAVRLVAMRDGRYDAATDRVRLTGLEPQQ